MRLPSDFSTPPKSSHNMLQRIRASKPFLVLRVVTSSTRWSVIINRDSLVCEVLDVGDEELAAKESCIVRM